ncbi:MAG: hypothetical protein QXL22_05890 [Candidatus Nezhaarchaeales archaeon]
MCKSTRSLKELKDQAYLHPLTLKLTTTLYVIYHVVTPWIRLRAAMLKESEGVRLVLAVIGLLHA